VKCAHPHGHALFSHCFEASSVTSPPKNGPTYYRGQAEAKIVRKKQTECQIYSTLGRQLPIQLGPGAMCRLEFTVLRESEGSLQRLKQKQNLQVLGIHSLGLIRAFPNLHSLF
jgi:hypothetical protein